MSDQQTVPPVADDPTIEFVVEGQSRPNLVNPEIYLKFCVDVLDSEFNGKDGAPTHMTENGSVYRTIFSGGEKKEGGQAPILCASERLAIDLWMREVVQLSNVSKNNLVWRKRPELITQRLWDPFCIKMRNRYYVYSRLVFE